MTVKVLPGGKEDGREAEGRLCKDLTAIAGLGMKEEELQPRNAVKDSGERHRHEFS